jgi:hypothetical protein
MTDIPATYGELEFGASRSMRRQMKMPKKGWYVWPSDINSLEAWMCGALLGPYANEEEAREAADTQCFEKVSSC